MFMIRKIGYRIVDKLSEVKQVRNNTGFGLYEQRSCRCSGGCPIRIPTSAGSWRSSATAMRRCPIRTETVRGVTKNNLYMLYDLGVQGIVNHSRIPVRLAAILGFFSSVVSLGPHWSIS
jgi:hypothetical protein